MSKDTPKLLDWHDLDAALELFTDQSLNQEIKSAKTAISKLAKNAAVETNRFAGISLRLNAPERVTADQRRYDAFVRKLDELKKERRRQFMDQLCAGTITAKAKRRIGAPVSIFLPSDAWQNLKLPQKGICIATDGSTKFYNVLFAECDPTIVATLDAADASGEQPNLLPRELVKLLLPKLFPEGKIVGTLKDAQERVLKEFDRRGWKRPSANTITNALEKSGWYSTTPHLKNR